MLQGRYIDPRAGTVTVAEYATRWTAAQHWRPSTAERTANVLRLHVLPVFGRHELRAVRRSEVTTWVKTISEGRTPNTVATYYRVLVALFAAAVDDRLIAESPCRKSRCQGRRPRAPSSCP